jgi:hypothetical protein
MGATPRILVGPGISAKASLAPAIAAGGPPMALTSRMFRMLSDECGGSVTAMAWLAKRVSYATKPTLVNLEMDSGESKTIVLAPRDWTQEKTAGFIAGLHDEIEAEFGHVSRVYSLDQMGRPA